jgi:hypothetical protein
VRSTRPAEAVAELGSLGIKKHVAMKTNDQLAKVIAQGKWRFILVRGVLVFGLLSATLVGILTFLFKTDASTWDFVRPFIFFPPMGIFWGAFMWSWMKRRLEASHNANA